MVETVPFGVYVLCNYRVIVSFVIGHSILRKIKNALTGILLGQSDEQGLFTELRCDMWGQIMTFF